MRGRFFEDFVVGDIYEHPLGRTITTTDNIWFTLLTQNTAPLHFDHAYAAKTEFGKPLVNSALTLSLVAGQSVTDVSQNVFANLGWEEVVLPHPVFEGDTIRSRSTVLDTRRRNLDPRWCGQGVHRGLHPERRSGHPLHPDSAGLSGRPWSTRHPGGAPT